MQTEAIFENIALRIQQEINKAEESIFIAVAWFTNKDLFNELLKKSETGCNVKLIISNDEINNKAQIEFDKLNMNNSNIYKVGGTGLMHNKFCVIDYCTVITGSYNWSYKAINNYENIVITTNDTSLAQQFIAEFHNILVKAGIRVSKEPADFPIHRIIKRLEIIKNYILLEDLNELIKEVLKLKEYVFNNEIDEIINNILAKKFSLSITSIQNFISKNRLLSVWTDPEVAALRLEIKNLENQLNAFDNEKIELEKLLSEFQHRHTIELGNIILEIFKLRKLKFKTNKAKFEEAENDERQYREQVNIETKKEVFEITEEDKNELKKKFRKATILCHPDKVGDEFKEAAQRIFIVLKAAYDVNDFKKVTEILNDLEKDNYFKFRSESGTEKDKLKAAIRQLHQQLEILESEIIAIKESETYKTLIIIDNWDEYFRKTKEKLQKELNELLFEVKS